MRNCKSRRFGIHEITEGKFKGSLHIATKSFNNFFSELTYLHGYLQSRLLPVEPEEIFIRGIFLDLQNVLEYESEKLITHYVRHNPTSKNLRFQKQMHDGYVSFKTKFEWLKSKGMLTDKEREIMDEVRVLRNALTHARPKGKRPKHKYFGKSLLTKTTVRRLFVDVEIVLRKLRLQSGSKSKWTAVPPGYASELKWPKEDIAILERK